jgi:hypothetical protein
LIFVLFIGVRKSITPNTSNNTSNSTDKSIIFNILSKNGRARTELAMKLNVYKFMLHIVTCCIGLCSRHSNRYNPQMWFTTFEFLLKERQDIRNGIISSTGEIIIILIGQLLQDLMLPMKSFVPSQEIIRRITQSYAAGKIFN